MNFLVRANKYSEDAEEQDEPEEEEAEAENHNSFFLNSGNLRKDTGLYPLEGYPAGWDYKTAENRYPGSPSGKGAPLTSYPLERYWMQKLMSRYIWKNP